MFKITQLTVQSMRIQVNKSIQGKFDEYALTDSGLGLESVRAYSPNLPCIDLLTCILIYCTVNCVIFNIKIP